VVEMDGHIWSSIMLASMFAIDMTRLCNANLLPLLDAKDGYLWIWDALFRVDPLHLSLESVEAFGAANESSASERVSA